MRRSSVSLIYASLVLCGYLWAASRETGAQPGSVPANAEGEFRRQLAFAGIAGSDPCEAPDGKNYSAAFSAKDKMFATADELLLEALNTGDISKSAERAMSEVRALETASEQINSQWPDDARFHAQVLGVSPLIVVTMTFWSQARFVVFGIPDTGESDHRWKVVGQDDVSEREPPYSRVKVYPIYRGPAGLARFLAHWSYSGCAGSSGEVYDAREWDSKSVLGLTQILKQEGSEGMDAEPVGTKVSKQHPFPPAGALRTDGRVITLPYCVWSPIDYWDNPSICLADRYDLSGDTVRFVSRTANRPELAALAKALEAVKSHEFQSLRGYCASDAVARTLMRDLPEMDISEAPPVQYLGQGHVLVAMDTVRFSMRQRAGSWLIDGVILR